MTSTNTMKVLLLSQYPPFVGGIETRSSNMVKYMDIPLKVVSPLLPDHSRCPSLAFDPEVVYLDYSNMGLFLKNVQKYVDMEEIGVIDVQCNVYLGVLGMLLSQKTGKSLISSFHMNLEHPDHAEAEFFAVHADLIRQTINESEKIVCVSKTVEESLLRFSRVDKGRDVHVISNGVDREVFHPVPGEKENALLFVGRFTKEKNLPFLFNLYTHLPEDEDMALWLVGDGPERAPLENLAKTLHIEDRVTFWGARHGEELARLYSAASVTVSPSATEAFGMTALESVACGTPVLASSNPGTRELMAQLGGGVLFTVNEVEGAVTSLRHLTEHYEEYQTQGLKNAEKFSWQNVLSPLRDLYREYV